MPSSAKGVSESSSTGTAQHRQIPIQKNSTSIQLKYSVV
jgi:hypothetical protein